MLAWLDRQTSAARLPYQERIRGVKREPGDEEKRQENRALNYGAT